MPSSTKPVNPWDPLPVQPMGDVDINVLFSAVGAALTAWENMEGFLGMMFAGLCGDPMNEGPARAYGVVSSSSGRLDMILQAHAVYRHRKEPTISELPKLVARIRNFGSRRNEIAHGIAMGLRETKNGVETDRGHYLCPAFYSSRKRPARTSFAEGVYAPPGSPEEAKFNNSLLFGYYAYNSSQIHYYREQFVDLTNRAAEMHGRVIRQQATQRP